MSSSTVQILQQGRVLHSATFERGVVRIGRASANDIAIDDPAVSRFHAELWRLPGGIELRDCASENGSFVNGSRVVDAVAVHPGDDILIGKYQLVLQERESAPAPRSAAVGVDALPSAEGRKAEPLLHAGLILQVQGKLERVLRWERERLVAGRSRECEILLADAEVSRRHALFLREGNRFEVRDLDSINGTYVNGEQVKRRRLELGDVVRIEHFELTFVIDTRPIGAQVSADVPEARSQQDDAGELTMLGELSPFGALADLSEPVAEQRASAAHGPETVTLELRLRLDELPEPLRAALAAGAEPCRVTAELRLRRD